MFGRKMDFSQCTRKEKMAQNCGSHIKNRPNGKIGDDGSVSLVKRENEVENEKI